jgi:hypothetical protein
MNLLWGAVQVALLCAAALGYGGLALPFLDLGKTANERLVARFALGLGLLVLATTAGGWLRLWGPWFHHGVLACGLLLLAAKPPHFSDAARPLFRKRELLWVAAALALLLFYAAFPPTFYDALLYHLGVPGYYLQAGGFAAWPENLFSALPQNAEMLDLLLLSGGSLHGPKFLSLVSALALLLYLADWGRASKLRHPWMPALIFFSIPEVVFLAATEKNDLLLMLFLLPGVRLLASLKDGPGSWKTCAASGVFLGLAGGVKWQGLLYGAAFVCAYFLTSRTSLAKRFCRVFVIGSIVVLLISPWLIKNQLTFHNPVHPYLGGLFSGDGAAAGQARQINEGVRRGQGFTPAAVITFFLHMFLSPYSLGLTHITGVLVLLLLPMLLFIGKLADRAFLLSGCAIGFVLLVAVSRVPRYFLPIFMVLSLPMAAGWEGLLERLPRFRRLAFALLSFLILVQSVQAVTLLERMTLGGRYVWEKLRGTLPAHSRYLDIIPYHRAAEFINSRLTRKTRTVFIGEERTFYVQRPFLASSSFDRNPALADLLDSPDAATWVRKLRQRGITHLLYCPAGLQHMGKNSALARILPGQRRRLEAILGSWTKLYDDGRYAIYLLPRS